MYSSPCLAAYAPFTPLVIAGNTRALRLTASAGTFLGRPLPHVGHYPPCFCDVAVSDFRPLHNILHCCPHYWVLPVFQCRCGCSYFHTSYGSSPWAVSYSTQLANPRSAPLFWLVPIFYSPVRLSTCMCWSPSLALSLRQYQTLCPCSSFDLVVFPHGSFVFLSPL